MEDPAQTKKETLVVPKPKKEPALSPRVQAKIKELEQRGLLTSAKAYVPPQDMAAFLASKARLAAQKEQAA